jgi:hypothetical protein
MVRFLGVSEHQALLDYSEYFIEANGRLKGRRMVMPRGYPSPCEQLRDLWSSFGQTATACEVESAQPTQPAPDPVKQHND